MFLSFNTIVTKISVTTSKKNGGFEFLLSVAADGVGCDNQWVCGQLLVFLRGLQRSVGLIDTNHNSKTFRYQLIGGLLVVLKGFYIIDTDLFHLAGVSILLWHVKDCIKSSGASGDINSNHQETLFVGT